MLQSDSVAHSRPDVAVVIVNYRTPNLTSTAISSVLSGSSRISKEVIVVDNGSKDGSAEAIKRQWGAKVVLVENNENIGFAAANNQAMRIAKGRYYFLLNSDAKVLGDSLEKMVRFADANPAIGIIGCKILLPSGRQQQSCWRTYNLPYLISRAFYLYRILPDGWFGSTNIETYGKPAKSQSVEVVSGCAMLVRRESSQKTGLFDERFFMYCEDTDWCTRMKRAGFGVYFLLEAEVCHSEKGSSSQIPGRMTIEQSRSVLRFMEKEYDLPTALLSNVFLWLFFAVRLPYWSLKSLAGEDKGSARRTSALYLRAICWHLLWPVFTR
jgi:GT2 family glycosyltransferase